ncbi:MAG TPA: glycosyltransferase family 1 protein [Verrucomicrobiae bacterium]|nr:glycosyltransferase family 1 protein [Verrucomicrobiae bacterium]
MRIGISTSVIQRGKTGVAQHIFALLKAFLAHTPQHQFTLFVLKEDLPLFDFARQAMGLVLVPETWRAPAKNILWHQAHLPSLAKRYALDVLHVPSYRRLLWPKPCPLVGTIHDLAPFRVAAKYDWKRMFYGRVIARRLAHRQDHIIAISQNTARDIATFFRLAKDRITIVPNGIDHSRFFPGPIEEARCRLSQRLGLNGPFFLYVARLEHPGKNHVRLISAFEEFKAATHSDWRLVLAGSDWHRAEIIHDAIRQSPCAADIRCPGFIPDSELPDWYCAASVFVYPSLYEGFGLPPLEAMACGCPVIASGRGSLAEVLGDAAALIEPEDFHTIARELYRLATDDALRNRLRAAGLAQARKFDWSRAAQETLEVYQKARTRQGCAPPLH